MRYKGNYVGVSSRPRIVRITSSVWMCPKCVCMCIEYKPIFKPGGAGVYYRMHGQLPKAKVTCPNGCHLRAGWGFKDVASWMKKVKNKHLQWK